MKKLMIAAALAAMVGGAYADTAYTFNASLKTTVGKSGKVTTTYNLGEDVGGVFWYADSAVTNLMATMPTYFTTKRVGGRTIPALSNLAKRDNAWLVANIAPLAATYNKKSAGKWCETLKVTDEGCYRVAGTKKFKAVVQGADFCCSELTTIADGGDALSITSELAQRFGGLTYEKAKKAELVGNVTGEGIEELYIAGQGSIGKVLDSNDMSQNDGITSISGNAVGILVAPECEYCCSDNQAAVAFRCDDNPGDVNLTTAAFGTFSLKYNAKATKSL